MNQVLTVKPGDAEAVEYTYDLNGNLLSDGHTAYTWTEDSRMATMTVGDTSNIDLSGNYWDGLTDEDEIRARFGLDANVNVSNALATVPEGKAFFFSKGSAYWYYDFGRDWYNCPEILQFFHKIAPVYDAVKDFSSSAEVAIIADWESGYYHAIQAREGGSQVYASMNTQPRELNNAGIQFDAFSFADIDNPALQKYKLFIFPQLFYMTPEKLAKLSAIKKAGKTLLFLNAPGWRGLLPKRIWTPSKSMSIDRENPANGHGFSSAIPSPTGPCIPTDGAVLSKSSKSGCVLK